jgi:hypothetical protein
MAATTTQPYLWSVVCTRDPDDPGLVNIRTIWRGRSLTTGDMVEMHVTNPHVAGDLVTKDDWDSIYSDMYDAWTASTADTTHSASVFTDYPPTV